MSAATVLTGNVRAAAVLLSMIREHVWKPGVPGLGFQCVRLEWRTDSGAVLVVAVEVDPADLGIRVDYRYVWLVGEPSMRCQFFADPCDAVGFIRDELFHQGCGRYSTRPSARALAAELHRIDLGLGQSITFQPCRDSQPLGPCRCANHWE